MLLCAKYIVPVSSEPMENGAVLVRDGVIADIGTAEMMRLRYPDEEVKDFGMAALTPGFIDLHARVEDGVLRGLIRDLPFVEWRKNIGDLRSRISSKEAYDSAYLGCLEELSAGVTTIGDTTSTGAAVFAAQDCGLRAVVYREAGAIDKRLVNYAMKKVDSDLEKWSQSIDEDRIMLGIAPDPVYECHPELYRSAAKYAAEHNNLPIAMKLAGSNEELRFVKDGATAGLDSTVDHRGFVEVPPWLPTAVTPVNYVLNWGLFEAENVMIVYGVNVSEDDIRHLRDYDVAVATCPSLNAQLGMGVAPVSEYLRSGLRIGLGTGAPGSVNYLDMFAEMRFELMVQRALSREFLNPQTLLEMATLRAAEVLRLDDKIGSLEIGKLADIIAIDLSGSHQTPTTDPVTALLGSASNSDVVMTMVNGNILYEAGRLHVGEGATKVIAHVLEVRGRLRS
ncbi:MAG: amidohydrolase family protein [Eggerthellaceae bacterium]|jgi:5-methylthioadenosine/S-adenosylhomocysteine deaminase|nr:amidohydrolase family protein [Eggerthellaceae bacterium]